MARLPDGVPPQILTVVARRVLLDALEALAAQRDAITLVGAQAVYLRADNDDGLTTPSYTSDADLGVDPSLLDDEPLLEQIMVGAGFAQGPDPGHWHRPEKIGEVVDEVVVDLMVADTFSGPGSRRSGVIPPHSRGATRRTPGLEPAAVDYDVLPISSLEPAVDSRVIESRVAGPAALMVAKAYKLGERFREAGQRRLVGKDAADVVRLMRTNSAGSVSRRFRGLLADPRSAAATHQGLTYLEELFGGSGRPGVTLAAEVLGTELNAAELGVIAPAYTAALLRAAR